MLLFSEFSTILPTVNRTRLLQFDEYGCVVVASYSEIERQTAMHEDDTHADWLQQLADDNQWDSLASVQRYPGMNRAPYLQ